MALDIVKFDGLKSRDWLIYKYPADTLIMGSQLVVQEGQVAVFARGGAIADVFYPGTYTLKTENLPLLRNIVNLPFGGRSPFSAEVYYVNTTVKLDINWGTIDPIQLIDPKYSVKLRVRAFGQMGLRVRDVTGMFREMVGGMQKDDWVRFDKIKEYYRGILVMKVKSSIASTIIQDGVSVLEIDAMLDSLSQKVKAQIEPEFIRYGFTVVNFFIQSINFPDEDFDRINRIMEDKAAFELMGDNRYAAKRSFDVYEGAANNQNGAAGAFVAGGLGLGAAVGIGSAMGHSLGNPMMGQAPGNVAAAGTAPSGAAAPEAAPAAAPEPAIKECVSCHAKIPAGSKFCPECGANNSDITCPGCGKALGAGTKFCPECGTKL